jgi:protein-S-isoprenylcysteine O-methyltransferase Ste14
MVLYGVSAWISVLTRRELSLRTFVGVPELSGETADDVLLREGVYSVVRHPRYLSVIIGISGFAMVVDYLGAYLVVLGTIPALFLVTLLEERELESRFGEDYLEYRSQVPAILPKIWKRPARADGPGLR